MHKTLLILIVWAAVISFIGCGTTSSTDPSTGGGDSGITLAEAVDKDEAAIKLDGSSVNADGAEVKLVFTGGDPSSITEDGNVTLVCDGTDVAVTVTQSEADAAENAYSVTPDNPCHVACASCTLTISDSVLDEETSFSFGNSCFVSAYFKGLFISDEDNACWNEGGNLALKLEDVLTYNSTDGVLSFGATGLSVGTVAARIFKVISSAEQFRLSVHAKWSEGLQTADSGRSDGFEIHLSNYVNSGVGESENGWIVFGIYVGQGYGDRRIGITYNENSEDLAVDNSDYELGQEAVMTIGQDAEGPYAYFTLDGGTQYDLDLTGGFPSDFSVFDAIQLVFSDYGNVNAGTVYEIESSGVAVVLPDGS